MRERFEQRRKIMAILRKLMHEHDLIPFITLKYLSQKQEESKDNLGEFIDEYGFYFRDYELLSSISEKQENGDESYLSDLRSSINALKNSSNPYIKQIYSRIPNKTLTDNVLKDILQTLTISKETELLYNEVTWRTFPIIQRRDGGELPRRYYYLFSKLVTEDHEPINVYNPSCRDAESIVSLKNNFQTATLYEKDEDLYYRAIQNMIIHNIPLEKIRISNEKVIIDESDMRYDAIISIPYMQSKRKPISSYDNIEKFKDYRTRNPNSLHLLNLIEHLSDDGILITVISLDLLVKRDAYNLRKCLIDKNLIESIIEYDKSYRNPNNIILIIRKNKESKDTQFIKENYEDISGLRRRENILYDCLKERSIISRFSDIITNEEIMENDYNLNPKRYVYTLDYEPKDLEELTSKQQEYTSQIRDLDGEIDEILEKIRKL